MERPSAFASVNGHLILIKRTKNTSGTVCFDRRVWQPLNADAVIRGQLKFQLVCTKG